MTGALISLLRDRLGGQTPRTGIILGSGLGALVEELDDVVRIAYGDLPGFPVSGVSGHAGKSLRARLAASL